MGGRVKNGILMVMDHIIKIVKNPKHYFVFACALLWVSLGIILYLWDDGQATISYVAVANRLSHVIFTLGLTSAALLMYFFFQQYFFDKIKAPLPVQYMFFLTLYALAAVGIVPATKGAYLQLHTSFAAILTISMVLDFFALASLPDVRKIHKVQAVFSAIILVLAVQFISGIRGQVIAIVLFIVQILSIVYFPKKLKPAKRD